MMPKWGLATAAAAPLVLVAGWTVAARLQPGEFDQVSQTISALAGIDASYRWVMTVAFIATGALQIATAVALRPAARVGRTLYFVGGACTFVIAFVPLPATGEDSTAHAVFAAGSFGALALWPLFSWHRGEQVAWGLRRPVALVAGCILVGVAAWFFRGVLISASTAGLSERLAAVLLNLWPLVVVLTVLQRQRQSVIGVTSTS